MILNKKIDFAVIFLFFAILAIFIFSASMYFIKTPGRRYVFRFESVDKGKTAIESRLLPRREGDEKITLYVEELLLGPKTERSRPIFSPGTRTIFCFFREGTLFVNLTNDLLYQTGNAGDIMDGISLFEKNVTTIFPQISKVELYMEGKPLEKENEKI